MQRVNCYDGIRHRQKRNIFQYRKQKKICTLGRLIVAALKSRKMFV